MLLSAIVLTKNEEKNIEECLKSVKWCDEILVIDDNSTDKTVEFAKKAGAKVFSHPLNCDFSQQRNFSLQKAIGKWVLFVDADEQVSSSLRDEIQNSIKQPMVGKQSVIDGFYFKREDKMHGKILKHGETSKVRLLRLGKRGAGEWTRPVHETWNIKGKTKELKAPLIHNPHPGISEFLEEINFYSTIRAKELYESKKKTNLFEIIFYPVGKFLKNYFISLGILDGLSGLIVAILMSFHSFLVRAKLYLIWKKSG